MATTTPSSRLRANPFIISLSCRPWPEPSIDWTGADHRQLKPWTCQKKGSGEANPVSLPPPAIVELKSTVIALLRNWLTTRLVPGVNSGCNLPVHWSKLTCASYQRRRPCTVRYSLSYGWKSVDRLCETVCRHFFSSVSSTVAVTLTWFAFVYILILLGAEWFISSPAHRAVTEVEFSADDNW